MPSYFICVGQGQSQVELLLPTSSSHSYCETCMRVIVPLFRLLAKIDVLLRITRYGSSNLVTGQSYYNNMPATNLKKKFEKRNYL